MTMGTWARLAVVGVGFAWLPAAFASSVAASSELRDESGVHHSAALAFDGRLDTGWAEGQEGSGEGAWIELRLDRPVEVLSVSIWPGNLSEGRRSLREYGRPHTLTVRIGGRAGQDLQRTVRLEDVGLVGAHRVDVPIRGRARTVRVRIDEAYPGIVHDDTFISQIALNFAEGEPHPWVRKVHSWVEGDEGVRPKERNREEVAALVEDLEEGDEEAARAALRELMDRAGNGAPFVRSWVERYVPRGFRIHATPPDPAALRALVALRDPTTIPALEQAAVRVRGHEQRRLEEQVEVFYALEELLGGPAREVPPWGATGWAEGQLRAFGEPLPLTVDREGRVYVADVGNSRVQRFGNTGRVERTWGADEPGITNTWIGGNRSWYVSGAAPGRDLGQIATPVGITLLPERHDDRFAVLDAAGRVQVFGPDGQLASQFVVPVPNVRILPGVGGQAHLLYSRGRLVVLWSDTAFVYEPDGEQVNRWTITDGIPTDGAVMHNGRLALAFGDQVVSYNLDGFRHGSLLGPELGEGFETVSLALDEDRRLWAVTDAGRVVKYRRPGRRVEFQVQLPDDDLQVPRIAVRGDVVYLTEGDRIRRIDVLEVKGEEERRQAEGQ